MQPQMAHQKTREAAALPKMHKLLLGRSNREKSAMDLRSLRLSLAFLRQAFKVCSGWLPKCLLGYAAQIALLAGYTFGQSPVYNDFTPLIKGVTVGAGHCYFWLRSPGAEDVHIACYFNGVLFHNAVETLSVIAGAPGKVEQEANFNSATVGWCFMLGEFTLYATFPDGSTPLSRSGTF